MIDALILLIIPAQGHVPPAAMEIPALLTAHYQSKRPPSALSPPLSVNFGRVDAAGVAEQYCSYNDCALTLARTWTPSNRRGRHGNDKPGLFTFMG